MTENEAKGWLIELKDCEETQEFYYADCIIEAFDTAIKALEEIQQYRAIGTVEEFKTLKEKNEPKKPRFYAHNYYCTECGNLVGNNEFEWQRFLYCDNCGQKLDWQ